MARRGRPRGSTTDRLWGDALRKIALEYAEGKAGPKKIELAARKLIDATIAGDMTAARELGNRLDGMPHQTQDITVTDERNVIRAPEKAADAEDWAGKHGPH